ncbi:MAG: glycosyltransferase, partial [Clostridia bacterium]|nr:glycosyltransferase [Clostridia bacterium]
MLSDYTDKISVIVPAYNIEEYLSRCLDSILNQTYENIEIIVVNDGSKDNTEKVIKEYARKDSRVKLISKVNEGVTKARLTGMKAAEGDWIGFVDGDDTIAPEMYET